MAEIDEGTPRGRHLIFIRHLCVCSTTNDPKQVLLEWRTGEVRKESGDGEGNTEILEYIRNKTLLPKELIMRVNGNVTNVPNRCICGVYIEEHCQIVNTKTNEWIWIGSCCVKYINEDDYHEINRSVNCLHRIINNGVDNSGNKPNDALIKLALDNHIINEREMEFLKKIKHKRDLTPKQQQWLESNKTKMVRNYSKDDSLLTKAGVDMGDKCACGKPKKEGYKQCWSCYNSTRDATISVCACGKTKKVGYQQCWECYSKAK